MRVFSTIFAFDCSSTCRLQAAIHSEVVIHVLALYQYVQLERSLENVLVISSKAAAKQLNG